MTENQTSENTEKSIYIKKMIKDLVPGNVLLHPIYRLDGLMLINKYKVLTDDLIQKVNQHVPSNFSVITAPSEELKEQFINQKLYTDKRYLDMLKDMVEEQNEILSTPISLVSLLDHVIDSKLTVEDSLNKNYSVYDNYLGDLNKSPLFLAFEKNLESQRLKERAVIIRTKLNELIESDSSFLDLLNQIKTYKDVLLLHSINTTSLSLMVGLTLELTNEQLLDLAAAALLIDVSLTQMPKDMFNYYLRYSKQQKEFYQAHIQLLKKISTQIHYVRKESIVFGVLDHYEKFDGTGYPKGKRGKEISLYGRIISIAHAYDEMVGGYFYNSGTKPLEAVKFIWRNKGIKFDNNIIEIFTRRINLFKIGESIIVNEYGKGVILGFQDYIEAPHLPIVKLDNGMIVNLFQLEKPYNGNL